MTTEANDIIKSALIFTAIAKKHFEYAKIYLSNKEKDVVNMQIKRLLANENDMCYFINNDKARDWFNAQLKRGDTLQFAQIVNQILDMDDNKRNLAETVIDGISQNKMIEFLEP